MKDIDFYRDIVKVLKYYVDKPSAFRCFIFYTNDWMLKTEISKKIAKDLDGNYINLLEEKLSSLNPKLGIYSPTDFKNDIIQWSKLNNNITIIDDIEPLFDTWDKKIQKNFFKMISTYRPDSIILISTLINLPYEHLLNENRIYRYEV